MGEKLSLKFYIAGPITGHLKDQGYREEIRAILDSVGHTYYDPWLEEKIPFAKGKKVSAKRRAKGIIKRDEAGLRKCDLLVAYFPCQSVGAAMELGYAHGIFIPTVAIIPKENGFTSAFYYKADVILSSIEEFSDFVSCERRLTKLLNKYLSR